jgi:Ca-activated chloride channel homolog
MSTTAAPFSLISVETREPAELSMQRLWLTGQVLPPGARLTVEHVFRSGEKKPLEVIYSFPLPRDAALRTFRISGEGFEIHSELKETEAAVKAYEEAITAGSLAALTRQYGDGMVNLTVGNIRPDEMVTVRLEILAGLELRDDGFRFRFPFTLAPGYHARARMADGAIELPTDEFGDIILPPIHKDATGLHEVGFDLSVTTQLEIEEIGSPSHAVRIRQAGNRASRITLAQEADLPNRDLVLEMRFKTIAPQVLAGKGHFAAIIPSTVFGANPNTPHRVVILLDRSGSMSGTPIQQAVKSIKACLGALSEQDLFGLIAFNNHVETFQKQLLLGSRENREKAHEFLKHVEASGGTELAEGFTEAVGLLDQAGGDVLIMTDGQVSGTEAILARARATNTRLHCLGIGSASQDRFLALLARETGGVSRFVTPRERVDLCAVDLFASIGRPVASGLRVEGNVRPQPPAAVISGTPVVLFGEGADHVAVEWEGGELRLPVAYDDQGIGETIRLLQGSRLITDWDSRYPASEAVAPLEKRKQSRVAVQLRNLSEEYGLASREASLVAVVKRAGDRPGELPETKVVPVGMPQDTHFEAYFGAMPFMSRISSSLPTAAAAPPGQLAFEQLLCTFGSVDAGLLPSSPSSPAQNRTPSRPMSRLRKSFARKDEVAIESATASETVDDLLMEVAARIEPDGGMPGRDADERASASIVALLAFVSNGHTAKSGAFRSHVERLISFLKTLIYSMRPERLRLIVTVLALVEKGSVPPGEWLNFTKKPNNRWKQVEAAIETLRT